MTCCCWERLSVLCVCVCGCVCMIAEYLTGLMTGWCLCCKSKTSKIVTAGEGVFKWALFKIPTFLLTPTPLPTSSTPSKLLVIYRHGAMFCNHFHKSVVLLLCAASEFCWILEYRLFLLLCECVCVYEYLTGSMSGWKNPVASMKLLGGQWAW